MQSKFPENFRWRMDSMTIGGTVLPSSFEFQVPKVDNKFPFFSLQDVKDLVYPWLQKN
jgi:hypothetical protein